MKAAHSKDLFKSNESSLSPLDYHSKNDVQLDGSNLLVHFSEDANHSHRPLDVNVPLMFSDLSWSCAPAKPEKALHILGVAPRRSRLQSEFQTDEVLDEVWLFCVCGEYSDWEFYSLLLEFCGRGCICTKLSELFRLQKPIGYGTFGTVYQGETLSRHFSRSGSNKSDLLHSNLCCLAETLDVHTQVAVKCLKPPADSSESKIRTWKKAVRSEIGCLAVCRGHPNITTLVAAFYSDHVLGMPDAANDGTSSSPEHSHGLLNFNIVLGFYPNGDLFDLLERSWPLPLKQSLNIMTGLLSALEHMHSIGYLHRDVKAENVLLGSEGQAVLADFGIAAHVDDVEAMKTFRGTPGYAAPEIVNSETFGFPVDIFSAGVLFYRVLSNKMPFPGENSNAILRKTSICRIKFDRQSFGECDGCLHFLLRLLLQKDPAMRPKSPHALKAFLMMSQHCNSQGTSTTVPPLVSLLHVLGMIESKVFYSEEAQVSPSSRPVTPSQKYEANSTEPTCSSFVPLQQKHAPIILSSKQNLDGGFRPDPAAAALPTTMMSTGAVHNLDARRVSRSSTPRSQRCQASRGLPQGSPLVAARGRVASSVPVTTSPLLIDTRSKTPEPRAPSQPRIQQGPNFRKFRRAAA